MKPTKLNGLSLIAQTILTLLAGALYSYNEHTSFCKSYLKELYRVLPKDKVDIYVSGRFVNKDDPQAMNYKYNEMEFVAKYRK